MARAGCVSTYLSSATVVVLLVALAVRRAP